jgi:hypothetical protein
MTMTSEERYRFATLAARRRRGPHVDSGDRLAGRAVAARRELPARKVGRVWLNGCEVGGADPRFVHLAESHD